MTGGSRGSILNRSVLTNSTSSAAASPYNPSVVGSIIARSKVTDPKTISDEEKVVFVAKGRTIVVDKRLFHANISLEG